MFLSHTGPKELLQIEWMNKNLINEEPPEHICGHCCLQGLQIPGHFYFTGFCEIDLQSVLIIVTTCDSGCVCVGGVGHEVLFGNYQLLMANPFFLYIL